MRTLSGVMFLMQEMTKLVHISTAIVARPIISPLVALVVVARVGHMPKSNTNVAFSLMMPFLIILSRFIVVYPFFILVAPVWASADCCI